jgi:hypothetical protein
MSNTFEFEHIVNGAKFTQGIDRRNVLTYTLIEKSNEIHGMKLYVNAIVVDVKTGIGVNATYDLDAKEAIRFRDWWLME